MTQNHFLLLCCLSVLVLISGCRATKYVPEGEYLLNKVVIQSDAKDISQSEVKNYLHQTPNSSLLGIWKLQLGVYNLSGPDTTKWINRTLRKMGDAPVILDSTQTDASVVQIEKLAQNKGYFNAGVSSSVTTKKQKATVTYDIKAHDPYMVGDYTVRIGREELRSVASDSIRSLVRPGMQFNVSQLNAERTRITNRMRRNGYYNFEKEYLNFIADSVQHDRRINLTLELRDYVRQATDSAQQVIFRQYTIREVVIHTGFDPNRRVTEANEIDTIRQGNYLISYGGGKRDLKAETLIDNCYIVPGELYNDLMVDRTYSAMNSLSPIKYVNITFAEVVPGMLDCFIVITPNKSKSFSVQGEGTFSAGDWGIAGNTGFTHRNVFRGAETFTVQGRAAYEWRDVGNTLELSGEAKLNFPNLLVPLTSDEFKKNTWGNTEFSLVYNYQNRPLEYTRIIGGLGMKYSWARRYSPFRHAVDILDFSYVYLPWVSDEFRTAFLNDASILKYSYEDHFIMRTGYSGSYSNYSSARPMRNHFTLRYGVETAGNLLYGASHLFNLRRDEDGAFKIFNIRYSQYVKLDTDFSFHQIFDRNNRFVYHAAFNIGVPYGNASSLPFEKRYYSGGANSVRGWAVRTLGPGTYQRSGNLIDFNNQSGDIKLDLNVELRSKLFWLLEAAIFLDGGNIWTIREYESQPGGAFKLNTFYKEIALAYGIGLRFDFSFFVFRIDYGIKLYDPAQDRRERWRNNPTWADDMAFHFAIGYPF